MMTERRREVIDPMVDESGDGSSDAVMDEG